MERERREREVRVGESVPWFARCVVAIVSTAVQSRVSSVYYFLPLYAHRWMQPY